VQGFPDRARHGTGRARRRRPAGLTSQAALLDTFSLARSSARLQYLAILR
jgi:hypothetical protein